MYKSKLEIAIDYAHDLHKGQYRNGSDVKLPYIVHPLEVLKRLVLWGFNETHHEDLLIASVLHDLIEDCDVTYEQLKDKFGLKVADLVMSLSRPDDSGKGFARKYHYLKCLKGASANTLFIKLSDRLSNVLDYYATPGSESYASKYALQADIVYRELVLRFRDHSQFEQVNKFGLTKVEDIIKLKYPSYRMGVTSILEVESLLKIPKEFSHVEF